MKKSFAPLFTHTILMFAASGIFAAAPCTLAQNQQAAESAKTETQHALYGTIRSIEGSALTIETRDKKMVKVNTKAASESQRTGVLVVGRTILIHGSYDAKGILQASAIQRAKSSPTLWPEDK
ncbi:MAG TPA: hypothetical protein VKT53_09110 [Candidatus Acidoferrum sp.]|nr:hypothetical protein [Candidatus Acidoferrum sp.]